MDLNTIFMIPRGIKERKPKAGWGQTLSEGSPAVNLVSPECVTPPRLLNTAVRGGVTNFATFTCLHHANNPNVK